MRTRAQTLKAAATVLAGVVAAGCGSASISTPVPTSAPAAAPPVEPVVKITAAGANPQILHVFSGKTVVFLNNDDRPHVIRGDPHPAHSQCSGRLNLGTLAPGDRREVEVEYGLCLFHDDADPANAAFMGMVILH